MAKSSGEVKFTLKLVVDEENKKVVFAEACRDFVDVLFSFLTLPMGTIVRLLENHRISEPVPIGCFSNLYQSVVDMGIDDFETEACKQMLLHPRSLWDVHCKRLKLNLHPTDGIKLFVCSSYSICKMCSYFSTFRCRCGKLMNEKSPCTEKSVNYNVEDGVFVRGRSSFIVTDDLKVAVRSTDFVLRNLKSVGCGDFSKVVERLVDVGFDEVMTLLQCIFSSNAPLTDTFLSRQSPRGVMKTCETLSPYLGRKIDKSEEVISFSAILRKHDMKVLYVECGEDFVDLLFTFLAFPLESILEISGDSSIFGCIGNLFKSFKDLSAAEVSTSKAVLPHYYTCQKQLLNIIIEQPLTCHLASNKEPVVLIDSKSHGRNKSTKRTGFVKRDAKFTVSDDLIITPMNSSSALCILKKLESQAEDLQVQQISISKTLENNKVVFAEACRDFVDVLFSLLTLPMGTIVRLLENHRKSEPFPCFSNLYKSVVDMGIDDFETEACKQLLLYPRSVWDVPCRRLKLNLNPTDGNKWFVCSSYSICKTCSYFSTSRCGCGKLMNKEMPTPGEEVVADIEDGVFVRGSRSSFIITDDMKVAVRSTDLVLKMLRSVGCGDLCNVAERLVEIGLEEVMTLLECIFFSNAPLTDTFLNKQSPKRVMKPCNTPSPYMVKEIEARLEVITISAIVRKDDMKILYVECGEDFVDLLFTFLAVSLESVVEISGDISTFGCIGNLFKSLKELNASTRSKAVLPRYYRCQKQLLNIISEMPPLLIFNSGFCVEMIDPKSRGRYQSKKGSGFVKRGAKFTVSDDLIITPMNTSSALCQLKKLESPAEDLQVQEISISKTQAASLLRASLETSSALNAALWNSTLKKSKQET
ncbi:unnamed protein product [Eruca vesicaria subsp. sativa]|uniref:DUF674 family protein n=1 Tax=Eruca vesicaria subsp. sativa TaxID=29727 RepID=A0ABC8ITY2_ERUVS|nr:unnamed protein product [Eruca vesicaria subsp. sativa]